MSKKIIILGTAHLRTTPGKHSIDKRLYEYAYSREIVSMLEHELKARGYTVIIDYMATEPNSAMLALKYTNNNTKELKYRVGIVNNLCKKYGTSNCVYVSIHVNAAKGDGKWHDARGFSIFVSLNASTNSKRLAKLFTQHAKAMRLTGNRSVPSIGYWQKNLCVLRETACPAVLTENLFQDNKADVDFLLSEQGRQAIVNLHLKAIEDYVQKAGA
jgi:N-acetylmuramoyl-L-alanine amidase